MTLICTSLRLPLLQLQLSLNPPGTTLATKALIQTRRVGLNVLLLLGSSSNAPLSVQISHRVFPLCPGASWGCAIHKAQGVIDDDVSDSSPGV